MKLSNLNKLKGKHVVVLWTDRKNSMYLPDGESGCVERTNFGYVEEVEPDNITLSDFNSNTDDTAGFTRIRIPWINEIRRQPNKTDNAIPELTEESEDGGG